MLERWSRRPKSPHSIAQRARIVLLAADDMSNKDVAEKVGVNPATVLKWRKRFLESRLDGLIDEPRSGAPRKITDADVEAVVVRTLEERPTDATHWSTRDLAAKSGMSASSVGRIWAECGGSCRRSPAQTICASGWVLRRNIPLRPMTLGDRRSRGSVIAHTAGVKASVVEPTQQAADDRRQFRVVPLTLHRCRGDWNYTLVHLPA